jgi:hypothetical protein
MAGKASVAFPWPLTTVNNFVAAGAVDSGL